MSRIAALPRRDWRVQIEPWIEPLSALLRTPNGTQTLRPVQAAFLLESAAGRARRAAAFLQGRMGAGKTLAHALLPKLLGCERPLHLAPGGILREMKAHIEKARVHWQIPVGSLYLSYSTISRYPKEGKRLEDLWCGDGPDGIFPDEADKLSNIEGRNGSKIGSAVAGLIRDYKATHPECLVAPATGTSDRYGMRDYWHLIDWALGDGSPLPRDRGELEIWARVIDEGNEFDAPFVGEQLVGADVHPKPRTVYEVRREYKARLRATPGIIILDDQYDAVPLKIREQLVTAPELDPHFDRLRNLWQRPDGLDLLDEGPPREGEPDRVEGSIWAVARRMARGLCYVLDPLPPLEWREARRAYFSYARALLEERIFYTEWQVRQHAIETNARPWTDRAAISPIYDPKQHQKTLWLSDCALNFAANWGEQPGGGVIFSDDIAFSVELARRTGWTYYAGGGLSRNGQYIEDAQKGAPIIASRKANGTGRNLQFRWNRMLFEQIPAQCAEAEQNVARVHREGLETWATSCDVDVMIGCREDVAAVAKIFAGAYRTSESIYAVKALQPSWERIKDPPDTPAFRS
jgi:hypothetical protein